MNLTDDDLKAFNDAEICHICEQPFTAEDIKVKDHDHVLGNFRGASHASCNLNYRNNFTIPCFAHNGGAYDWHFLIKEICQHIEGNLQIIPRNMEHYLSVIKYVRGTKIKLQFIDSFRFLNTSLDKLVSFLNDDQKKTLKSKFPDKTDFDLLSMKGICPYEYIDSREKLKETKLPEKKYFFSKLTESNISDEEYTRAQIIWDRFKCRTIKDYYMLYLQCDVLLLCDVFENFRDEMLKYFNLHPTNYISLPSYSFDAMLRYTKVEIELLSDIDQLMFFERGIRGGLCQVNKNYVEANNKYMADYNPDKQENYLLYLDINALYSCAMGCHFLPKDGFKWVENCENFDVRGISDTSPVGYVLEVDLTYPNYIHDTLRSSLLSGKFFSTWREN